ncbi:MAG: hypothetical protein KatS3mg108_2216 [Isosphaeraceae bacterium]|nr:MAG: hypothetical protein KatS3mg108_2216 [Isosphaeraceae bacterium]
MNATARPPQFTATRETIDYRGLSADEAVRPRDNPGPRDAQTPTGRFLFASGDRPLDGYTIKRAIGRGGFGEVYYAVTDAGKEVALKLIMRNHDVERRGVMQCMNLKSPHLITIHDLRVSDDGDCFVIMEYVAGPSLETVLRQHPNGLPHDQVLLWLRGLVEGVAYLHDHGIVHRDLKPANLFLEEGVVKIGDYGLSKAITTSKEPGHSQSVGTCHYMAPEIGTGKYHKPIDIYAMGVILYEMLTGRVPFDGESVHEVLMKHLTARPDLTGIPEPFRPILERALAKDPNLRPQRAHDLLPPGHGPTPAELRIIPEDRLNRAQLLVPPAATAAAEDVVRIGPDEEPILYIGPDTMPPQPPPRPAGGWDQFWRGLRGHAGAQSAPLPRRQRSTTPRQPRPSEPPRPASPRLPEPPPLPPPRTRLAELTTSMLIATVFSAVGSVLAVPFFSLFGGPHPQDPGQLALLFGVVLLGSWSVMAASKYWEGSPPGDGTRRLVMLGLGLVLGQLLGLACDWCHVALPDGVSASSGLTDALAARAGRDVATFATLAGFYGLAFAATRLWQLADRDREHRFRLGPLVSTGLVSGVIALLLEAPQPWGPLSIALIALVTQLSSPWNRQAAAYALYVRRLGKSGAQLS